MSELSETPFRVYALDQDQDPVCLGAADDVSLGELYLDLHRRGKLGDGRGVGLLYRPVDGEPGEWLTKPWA